jgi:hypothetical protein
LDLAIFGVLVVSPRGFIEEGGHYVFTLCNSGEFCLGRTALCLGWAWVRIDEGVLRKPVKGEGFGDRTPYGRAI